MKIALCGRFNTDIRHQGGSAEVFLALAEKLSKYHNVTLFGRGKPTKEIVDMCNRNGIKFYYIPSDTLFNIFFGPIRAFFLLNRNFNNFDLIHTHNGSYAFASIFFKNKCKIITHIHEITTFKDNSFLISIYLVLENFLVKLGAKHSDLSITASDYMKAVIEHSWKIKKIVRIKLGIDTEIFQNKKNEKFNEIFEFKTIKLLFVGRLTKRKGILELVDSLGYLKSHNLILCIVGTGELDSQIRKIISNKNIKLLEPINNAELPSLYAAADLVVVPSYYEPTGLVPLESLSCGTAVLVSNYGGLKEIEPAFFLSEIKPESIAKDIMNALESIHKKPSEREYREYILENHSWVKIMEEYEFQYKSLLGQAMVN